MSPTSQISFLEHDLSGKHRSPQGATSIKKLWRITVSNVAIIPALGARGGAIHPARRSGERKEPNPFSTASFRLIVLADNLACSLKPKSPPSGRATVILLSSSLKVDTYNDGLNGDKSSRNSFQSQGRKVHEVFLVAHNKYKFLLI